ncbi:hypothetical protein B0T10DRAFT_558027 [Thelonectria olida]|uniref:F-box domain-containing protein n=1 Tax=Thelonectria olida TaxID=1576542 RepID=A0A9P9AWJ1_9HYPO|nr:hypothetical protein B0T10DRAFT_558027 [Thelonectria olida]
MAPPRLTTLPPEILHHIFTQLDPADIVTLLPHVCSAFRAFTKGNRKLHRDIYLQNLDPPSNLDLDYETEIRDIVRLRAICLHPRTAKKRRELEFVHDVVNRLLQNASPSETSRTRTYKPNTHASSHNADLLKQFFTSQSTREAFLQRSSLFERVRNERHGPVTSDGSAMAAVRQRSAKLHCLYGKPILHVGPHHQRTYPYAASKVYDLRQYTRDTRWGPFLDDGSDRVDWEKVEAIIVVLVYNLSQRVDVESLFYEAWNAPFSGSWPGSFSQPSPSSPPSNLELRDPYGVTGVWYRIVCFLDYNTLFSYNFPVGDLLDAYMPRPPLDADEVTRLITMKIYVTKIEEPGPEDGQDLPVVHFKGRSHSLDNSMDGDANSGLRGIECKGTVRLTREGEVRWTTFSIFHGQERWRSEGIQLGGVGSARGVIGHWFDRDYDVHGPAGPTAFWKARNETAPPQTAVDDMTAANYVPYAPFLDFDDLASDSEDGFPDDEDDGQEEIHELEVNQEIPGLLLDAQLDVMDVLDVVHQQAEQT